MEAMRVFRYASPALYAKYCSRRCKQVARSAVGAGCCHVSSWSSGRAEYTAGGNVRECHVQQQQQQRPDRVVSTYTGVGRVASLQKMVEPFGMNDVDSHNGVHVDLGKFNWETLDEFNVQLEVSLGRWIMEKRCAAWLRVPIEKSALIAEAAKFGFQFHHAEGTTAMLYIWLRLKECKIHPFASHQVGVAGCIVHPDTSSVLVVQDKKQKHSSWKFPGGLSELGEDIAETAEREVLEETGLQTEFKGVLAFRQQHRMPGAFGRSDLYFVCHLVPLTFDIQPCDDEISACRWISLDELLNNPSTTALTTHVALLVQQGIRNGFNCVAIASAERKSIYRGLRFKMFSRPLGDNGKNVDLTEQSYLHDIVDWKTK